MSIHGQIRNDMVVALKARDSKKREALAFLVSELARVAKDEKVEFLPDDRALGVLRKSLKQRRETLDAAVTGLRQDLADEAKFEIDLISAYLPASLGASETEALVVQVIADLGATSVKDMGKVMAEVGVRAPGVDKSQLSGIVKARLVR